MNPKNDFAAATQDDVNSIKINMIDFNSFPLICSLVLAIVLKSFT